MVVNRVSLSEFKIKMSQILSQWLNEDIRLSKQVTPADMDTIFRNGYLLGELLHRLQLEDCFKTEFVNSTAIDAAIKNFSSLERCLREKLGIHLTSNTAIDLITAKPGCAAKLLHQIKSSLTKTQLILFEEKKNKEAKTGKPILPPLKRTDSSLSYPGATDGIHSPK